MADEKVGFEMLLADEDFIKGVSNYLNSLAEMNRATSKASGQMNKSGAEMGKGMALMAGAVAGATSAATNAVINMVGSVVREIGNLIGAFTDAAVSFVATGISTNATLEQLQIKLETVTGAGEEMLAWIRETSKATPFTSTQLGDVVAMAAAYGFTADEAKYLALTAGDVSAAMGGGQDVMNSIIRALGQMQARTKVAAGEMLQLTEQGIPAWQILADAMGISVAELQDLVSKGMVPASEALPILTAALEDKFGGAMEEQSQTAKGLFETLQETIQLMAADITTPVFDVIKEVLLAITSALEGADFAGFVKEVQTFMVALIEGFKILQRGEFGTVLIPAIADALSELFGSARGAPDFPAIIGGIAAAINDVAVPLAAFIKDWQILASQEGGLIAFGDALHEIFYGTPIGDFGDAMFQVATTLTDAWNIIMTVFNAGKAVVVSVIETLQSVLGPTIQNIVTQLTGILSDFGLDWSDVWNAIKTAVSIVAKAIGGILALLVGVIVGVVTGIARAVEQIVIAWRNILPPITQAIQGLMKYFTGLYLFFVKLFEGDFPAAFEALKVAWSGVKDFFIGTALAIWEGLKGTFNMITGFFSGFVDGIVGFFQNLYDQLIGHSIVTDMVMGIFDELELLTTRGQEIFQGFIDGIFAIAQGLVANVTGLFGDIASGIASVFTGGGGGGGKGAEAAAPEGGGAAPAAAGPAAPGADFLEPIRQQIAQLQGEFTEFLTFINQQLTLLLESMSLSFSILLEGSLYPFLTAIQQMSGWIAFAVMDLDRMAKAAMAIGMAFTAFRMTAVAEIVFLIASTKTKFEEFNLYLAELKARLARHWLDFTVAMQALTANAIANIEGSFDEFLRNFGGDMTDFTNEFDAAAQSVMNNLETQLQPTLKASGSAFKALAQAAMEAASEVAAHTKDICDSVTQAHDCATASPELVLQHPFEAFTNYLKKASPMVSKYISDMVNPLDDISEGALRLGSNLDNQMGRAGARSQMMSQAQATTVNNYNEYKLGPVYQRPQDPASMIDDLALMNLLSGS